MEKESMYKTIQNLYRDSIKSIDDEADSRMRSLLFKKLSRMELQREAANIEVKKIKAKNLLRTLADLASDEVAAYFRYKLEAEFHKVPASTTTFNHIADEEYHHFSELIDMMRNIVKAVFE